MKSLRRILLITLMTLGSVLGTSSTGFSADPLPGTCGLPIFDNSTFAFAAPGRFTDVPLFDRSLASCQAGTMDMTYVHGCGADYYAANTEHGALNLSLAQSGFHSHGGATTTLLDVINPSNNQAQDPYLQQAVTAYLNSLYVDGYAYSVQEVLDGYHTHSISQGDFAWNNQGASNQMVIHNCPLRSSSTSDD